MAERQSSAVGSDKVIYESFRNGFSQFVLDFAQHLGVTDLKSGPVSNSLGDTWDFILSEFRADDPHVAQLVIALKCLVDTDMVWVRMRVDDGSQPNTLFPTV